VASEDFIKSNAVQSLGHKTLYQFTRTWQKLTGDSEIQRHSGIVACRKETHCVPPSWRMECAGYFCKNKFTLEQVSGPEEE
jgi:hypothetical protein